jgi:hypothetical protein
MSESKQKSSDAQSQEIGSSNDGTENRHAQSQEAEISNEKAEELKQAADGLSKLGDKPEFIREFMMMAGGPTSSPLHHKMNSQHIDKVLDLSTKHDERQYNLTKQESEFKHQNRISQRRYVFCGFIIAVLFVGVLVVAFNDKPDVLIPILTGLGGILGGGLGGFGLGRNSQE